VFKHLLSVRDGAVLRLTLNRPDVRNALNDEVVAELATWAGQATRDRTIRAAVLSGEGKSFSAGADVQWMAKTVGYSEAENLRDATALTAMFAALDGLPFPLVGRIQGAALGGGAGLAAICDIVISEDQAVFGFTEVKLGIVPAAISPFVLAKIGRSAARELFLTGARFSAHRAQEIGLVHHVVPAAGLDHAVASCLNDVLAAGPEAVAAAKALIREVAGRSIEDAAPITARTIAARRVSAEGQEGLRAFLEKRAPSFDSRFKA
jgi:methylglutaconyl-CoA hydratase